MASAVASVSIAASGIRCAERVAAVSSSAKPSAAVRPGARTALQSTFLGQKETLSLRAASQSDVFARTSSRTMATTVRAAAEDAPVALITGGARGIGRAVADALAAGGCRVAINWIASEQEALEAAAEAKQYGAPDAMIVYGNCAKPDDAEKMVDEVVKKFGRLDILINNAGITKDTLIARMKPEQWQAVIDVNLSGVFYVSQAALKVMAKQRKGRIVNMASVVGITGNVGQVNYSASKGGVIAVTKTSAREYAKRGISINAIAPGFIKTDMTAVLGEEIEKQILANIPMGRMGSVQEVAGLAKFLALDPCVDFITGQVFVIDGGMVM
eukprot:jgi/Mesvir1/17869/Mv12946-RA.1